MDFEHGDLWAVIHCVGRSYIGKVNSVTYDKMGRTITSDGLTQEDVLASDYFSLCPAYDYSAPFRQTQAGLTRDPIVTPPDFSLDDVPVVIKSYTSVQFFNGMTEADRETYEGLIKATEHMKSETRKARSAQRSGIILSGKESESDLLKKIMHTKR